MSSNSGVPVVADVPSSSPLSRVYNYLSTPFRAAKEAKPSSAPTAKTAVSEVGPLPSEASTPTSSEGSLSAGSLSPSLSPMETGRGSIVETERLVEGKYSDTGVSSSDSKGGLKPFDLTSTSSVSPTKFVDPRGYMPKIDYTNLVKLSFTNLHLFQDSVHDLGYNRCWPVKYSRPTPEDLRETWNGVEIPRDLDDICRKESAHVLKNLVPAELKYLVRKIPPGDTLSIWRAIFTRFRKVTQTSKKVRVMEFYNLNNSSDKLPIDEFVALVLDKSYHLQMMGCEITPVEEATVFIDGLNEATFGWLQDLFRESAHQGSPFTIEEVSARALSYANDRGLLKGSLGSRFSSRNGSLLYVKDPSAKSTHLCNRFNSSKGCPNSASECKYVHQKRASSSGGGSGTDTGANTGAITRVLTPRVLLLGVALGGAILALVRVRRFESAGTVTPLTISRASAQNPQKKQRLTPLHIVCIQPYVLVLAVTLLFLLAPLGFLMVVLLTTLPMTTTT